MTEDPARSAGEGLPLDQEDQLFDRWRERLATRAPKLFRDGPPAPEIYARQETRVVFVFREPNITMQSKEHDLREELAGPDVNWKELSNWWTDKVTAFAHAVSTALANKPWAEGWKENRRLYKAKDERLLRELLKHAYIQLKKTGGGDSSVKSILKWYVEEDADLLQEQLEIYDPDLIIACGLGSGAPAALLRDKVFTDGFGSAREVAPEVRSFPYWLPVGESPAPGVLIQFYHPAARGVSRRDLYRALWKIVTEVGSASG